MPTCLDDVAPNVKGGKRKKKVMPEMFKMRRLTAGEEPGVELVSEGAWTMPGKEKSKSKYKRVYYGPRGGKYSDPEHRHPWKEGKDTQDPETDHLHSEFKKAQRKTWGDASPKEKYKLKRRMGRIYDRIWRIRKKEESEDIGHWVLEAKGGKKYLAALFANKVLGERTSKPGKSTIHQGAGKYGKRSYRVTKLGKGQYSVKRSG